MIKFEAKYDRTVAVTAPTNDVIKSSNGIAATKTQSQQNSVVSQQITSVIRWMFNRAG